jgi:hypothetical protein
VQPAFRTSLSTALAFRKGVAERRSSWQHVGMRRQSVADSLREAERSRVASLTAAERVRLALELGRRSLESYCATSGLAPERARRLLESRAQAGRRKSRCLEDLLG